MESIGGTRASRSDPDESGAAMRGGFLWAPVGEPRSRFALLVMPAFARTEPAF